MCARSTIACFFQHRQMVDYFQKHAFERPSQASAEKRIDDDVESMAWFRDLFPTSHAFAFDERQRRRCIGRSGFETGEPADGFEVSVRVAGSLGELAKEHDATVHPGA